MSNTGGGIFEKRPERVVVKVGSNVLTRPDGSLDVTRMSAIVDQLAALHSAGLEIVLVSSGAVASGRGEFRRRGLAPADLDQVSARQLFSAVGQARLINRYYEFFRDHSIICGQILATKENLATRRHYLNQKHCMGVMLGARIIPVVNENDTVSVTELMFTDNDELSGLIASMMDADALIILSNIDGLYTCDPALPEARLIRRVGRGEDAAGGISDRRSSLGRGGMATKYRIAGRVADEGIAVVIANGTRDHILTDLLGLTPGDAPCTLFEPAPREASSLKRWIAHGESFAKGSVTVNQGAAEALLRGGASLLPVGVTDVEGAFEAGDIITVVTEDGRVIACGRAAIGAAAAERALGRKRNGSPLIHADYLYVYDNGE
ncbi:MAG: glutamate 5-kinase [Muribaculaceae bacterium]|nr:glutamate 5-kinase [Muribaculaceae bacterium]